MIRLVLWFLISVHWDSHLEEYGSGSYFIERLARPKLTDCTETDSE